MAKFIAEMVDGTRANFGRLSTPSLQTDWSTAVECLLAITYARVFHHKSTLGSGSAPRGASAVACLSLQTMADLTREVWGGSGGQPPFDDVRIIEDDGEPSGISVAQAQLRRVIDQLEKGDVLTVTRLDRLARSTRDLLNTLATITDKRAGFRSLNEGGKRAKDRGVHMGRPALAAPAPGSSWPFGRTGSRLKSSTGRGSNEAVMANPAGESNNGAFRLDFDRRLTLQFRGSIVTSGRSANRQRAISNGTSG